MTDIPIEDLKDNSLFNIAFYNVENLFDIHDDEFTNDDAFLPTADKKWTAKRYKNKLRKLGFAISNIGKIENGNHPALIGLAEVENAHVLDDLLASKHLKELSYDFVHYDSKDERGIDVALLYDTDFFAPNHSEIFSIELFKDDGTIDYTRDILLVSGDFEGDPIHIIINHWSSRREGEKETEHKRLTASKKVGEIIEQLKTNDTDAKIIVMGDFNDDPSSLSIRQLVSGYDLFNPMETLLSYNRGTTSRHFKWNLFDQILFSTNFFEHKKSHLKFMSANIFDDKFLKLFNGKYKGSPFRTYVGKKYKGGYSDHFPVYVTLKKI